MCLPCNEICSMLTKHEELQHMRVIINNLYCFTIKIKNNDICIILYFDLDWMNVVDECSGSWWLKMKQMHV